jgi:hypothetical protein
MHKKEAYGVSSGLVIRTKVLAFSLFVGAYFICTLLKACHSQTPGLLVLEN